MSFVEILTNAPSVLLGFGVLWLFLFICVPIIQWVFPKRGEAWGISAGVVGQVAVVLAVVASDYLWWQVILLALAVPAGGWLAEFIGSRTGLPFGPYHYTEVLKPQIGRVPVLIPMAWLMMMPPSWALGHLWVSWIGLGSGFGTTVVAALFAAFAFTAWDFFLDPMMVKWKFWQWHKPGGYFGIPWINFGGWFLVSFVMSVPGIAAFGTLSPLLLWVYGITTVLMAFAHSVFWNLRGPAAVGTLFMVAAQIPLVQYFL